MKRKFNKHDDPEDPLSCVNLGTCCCTCQCEPETRGGHRQGERDVYTQTHGNIGMRLAKGFSILRGGDV